MTYNTTSLVFTAFCAALFAGLSACERAPDPAEARARDNGHAAGADHATGDSNRIAIPATVRSNLGITFVNVERRRIEQTLRMPGRFEYMPTARREYRTMLPGRVELLVDQFERVDAGAPLYRIDSPAWREHQQKLNEADSSIVQLEARVASFAPLRAAHRTHEQQLEETIAIRRERVEHMATVAEAGGGRRPELIAARDSLSTAEAELAEVLEKEAVLEADEAVANADLTAAQARFRFLLEAAASIAQVPVESLLTSDDDLPRWQMIKTIDVRAAAAGVIDVIELTNGAWATQESTVLSIVQPELLRFRASALQSDLGVLRDGLRARIVPPTPTSSGRSIALNDTMTGTLRLGLVGNPQDRTLELFVAPDALRPWARPGVSAQLELVTDTTTTAELAIPLAAVQRDGLNPVFFMRAAENPDEAIRVEADLGTNDGRWVAVLSGVKDGDEVVLDGAFQLMLATSGTIQQGGHFHADGTFHAEEH